MTVITDLGKVHEGWLVPEVDAVVVPAREVYQRALERGIPRDRIFHARPSGPPEVRRRGRHQGEIRAAARLAGDKTIALLMAGGEGGGKLLPTTLALAQSKLPLHLRGRDRPQHARCARSSKRLAPTLPTPMTVLGYRDNIPELMRASDMLVTKAGPGAIAEASVAEVPVVVYDFVPGQERGNLDYVRTNGIGVVALTTADVVRRCNASSPTRNGSQRCAAAKGTSLRAAPRAASPH